MTVHVNTADTFRELKMMVNHVVQIHALTYRGFWKMELVWIASPTQELATMERDVSLRHAMIDRDCCQMVNVKTVPSMKEQTDHFYSCKAQSYVDLTNATINKNFLKMEPAVIVHHTPKLIQMGRHASQIHVVILKS